MKKQQTQQQLFKTSDDRYVSPTQTIEPQGYIPLVLHQPDESR